VTFFKLERIQEMLDMLHGGKVRGKLGVKFS
jgi:hypothetical protein